MSKCPKYYKMPESQKVRLPKNRSRENCNSQFYFVVLNVEHVITKSLNPNKLDYLKSGFGKLALLSFTLFSSLLKEFL